MTRVKAKPMTFLLLLFLSLGIIHPAGTQIIPINETFQARMMAVDEQNVYLADPTSIYIYSQKDFKLVNKAGRAGSRPVFSELPIEAGVCEIYYDKFYKIIDNEEKEIYELHITPF